MKRGKPNGIIALLNGMRAPLNLDAGPGGYKPFGYFPRFAGEGEPE